MARVLICQSPALTPVWGWSALVRCCKASMIIMILIWMYHLIEASADHSGQKVDGNHAISHRVIADHLRSSAFLIADGVLPSNEGRGYVLRRIMRRAMRHAHMLGTKEPLLWQLVPALKMQMAAAYPELERANALIVETLKHEEERFRDMLGRGLKLLDEEVDKLSGDTLAGDVAFKLYDTYGLSA